MSEDMKRSITERYGGSDLLTTLMNRLGGSARSEVVFGSPIEHDAVTVIPVARVRYGIGFGFGAGSGSEENPFADKGGGGGGGGVTADPIGFIEVDTNGARFVPIGVPANRTILLLSIALAATLIYIFAERKKKINQARL